MSKDNKSFSQLVKEEISNLEKANDSEMRIILAFTLASLASYRSDGIRLKINNLDFAEYINACLEILIPEKFTVDIQMTQRTFKVNDDTETADCVKNFLLEVLDFNSIRGQIRISPEEFSSEDRALLLRSGFLANGSMAMPEQNYQIEFSIKRRSVNRFYKNLLELEGFDVLDIKQKNQSILYLKSGDEISDFLGTIGSHRGLLNFENVRVHKNVNEQVNRAMNFDNANIERVANTSAKQISGINRLIESNGFSNLPDDLKEIAIARIENPGYSLREIGESLIDPISKSGVYHRFSKLEKWINSYFETVKEKK